MQLLHHFCLRENSLVNFFFFYVGLVLNELPYIQESPRVLELSVLGVKKGQSRQLW